MGFAQRKLKAPYIVMAYIVTVHKVMARVVMADVVMASHTPPRLARA